METLHVFIGYDPREAVAYHVCANSIIRHASRQVALHPVALNLIPDYREQHSPESGLTGYKPSNQFIFSRFLVPWMMGWNGMAVFLDGDMLVRDDIAKVFEIAEADIKRPVHVVKHEYRTKSATKYLGQHNADYPRKNWSSVILWNCNNFKNRVLTPDFVEKASGEYLHRFSWLTDDDIGGLPIEWNWLCDEYGENQEAKLIHPTLGTPCFLDPEYSLGPMAAEWHREKMLANYAMQTYIPGGHNGKEG